MTSKSLQTFKQRVLQSGSWTLLGYGVNQALRLAGNLVLTRLLFPEAFGLMGIVQAVMFGVHMLTDVGVGPSIVQKEHGNAPEFLNTAWTVQIVRGGLVWLGLCILAFPISRIYGEPVLAWMLPVAGLNAVIAGFSSTKLHTAQRNLDAVRVTQIDVVTYALGLLLTIVLAWLVHSVWSLVWGGLITVVLQTLASHTALRGIKNRFAWNRDVLAHLRGFGRWILLGSSLTFLSVEGSRLLIGAVLDMRQLALFSLASTMNLMFWQAMQLIAQRVFFPAYSEIYRTDPIRLTKILYKARLTVVLPSWGLALGFVFYGHSFMSLLYDSRYVGSGAMLELLAAGSFVACIWGSYSGVLLATGKVATTTALTAIQICCQFALMFIGYKLSGGMGLIMGVAAANWVVYPFYAIILFKNGLWQPRFDLLFLALSIAAIVYAWPRFAAMI